MALLPPNMQNSLRSWFLGTTFPAAPTNLYLALYTTAPSGDSGGTEVSGAGYARKTLSVATDLATDGAGKLTNATTLTFAAATADWGTVVGWALMSAASGGTRRAFGTLKDAQAVPSGKTASFAPGELDLDFSAV